MMAMGEGNEQRCSNVNSDHSGRGGRGGGEGDKLMFTTVKALCQSPRAKANISCVAQSNVVDFWLERVLGQQCV